jgi:hypothetical protein
MSRMGAVVIELQEMNSQLHDYEPDFMDYAKDYMATKQYAVEHNEQEQQMIDTFIDSVKEHSL